MRNAPYLEALDRRVLVFDGAMGTQLMALELDDAAFGGTAQRGCFEALNLSRPQTITAIHEGYLLAGADVIETNSFTASRLKLGEFGIGDRTVEVNRTAAALARAAADRYATPDHPRFVAGALGPTGMLISSSDPALSKIAFDELADLYREQATALVEGGVDLLVIETSQDLLEMKAAIAGIVRAFDAGLRRVPIQAQATLDVTGRMLLGTNVSAVCATLDALPIDVIGLNCSTGPEHMRDAVRYLVDNSRCYVSVIPNAGLPLMGTHGETIYPETPREMATELSAFVRDFGVNAIGGCCGTRPEHVAALCAIVDELERQGVRGRRPEPKPLQLAASAMTGVPLLQEGSPLLIGERINAQGSRKIKRLLLAEDYDAISLVAREQVERGAHLLDVCTALTERTDEDTQTAALVKRLAQSTEAPLVIDSTEPRVIEAALKIYAGRPVVNSINLENGRVKLDAVMPLVREAGAAVIALTIDEAGMAKTAERKLEIARRIADIVTGEYEIPAGALIFDALTFTLATGDQEYADSAVQTIEGIRAIKRELPGVLTSLGVSNVSFGLKPPARAALNSVMLHHCVAAGLDMAIVNAPEITPYAELGATERELCDDLVFNRRPDALQRVIEHWESSSSAPAAAAQEEDADAPVEVRIHNAILRRRKDGIEAKIDEVLRARDPVDVLNNVLLPAMKEVGDKFGAGELILPFVLQSAEVMKKAVAHLEQFLERTEGVSKGRVVLATVFGDVHDIGKNLVNTILSNNGYTVYDLGKQVPMSTILDKAVEVNADAIGLSALLVSTSKQMPVCVKEQDVRGLAFPIVVGGAAINRDFGRRIAFLDEERAFEPGVYYAKDAFEGLEIMDRLVGPGDERERFRREMHAQARATRERDRTAHGAVAADGRTARETLQAAAAPAAPFYGPRIVDDVDVRTLWPCFDLRSLYRLSWGGANAKGEEWERIVRDEFAPRLAAYQARAESGELLLPRAVYAYFPAAGFGDDVIVFAPDDRTREIARFRFTRQIGGEHLCLADYLREPVDGGASDVIAMQVVTVGGAAGPAVDEAQARGDYSESYFLHGFAVQSAEALAEAMHRRIRTELGLEADRGKRYSWGYGACPDLSQHQDVWRLLDAERAIGTSLTEAFQIVPEQSTAAIVVHHPQAAYFNAAAVRELTTA